MARSGHYRLAWQNDVRALFAETYLSVEWSTDNQSRFELPPGVNQSWAVGAQFGFEVFQQSVLGKREVRRYVHVRIKNIIGQSVDTTPAAVAYSDFCALCQAMELDGGCYFQFVES